MAHEVPILRQEKRLSFGVYPGVTLKAARGKAAEARKVLQDGGDPGALRKAEKARAAHESVNTLEAVAGDWMKHQGARPLASIKP